jgi:predicted nucleic acid-binding protein
MAVRVVLDTNVLLSLFVFADSRYAPLRERLESGEWLALTDDR